MIYKCFIITILLFVSGLSDLVAQNGISAKVIKMESTSDGMLKAQYPGGDSELCKFLENNIRYPYILAKIEMEGDLDVAFTVGKDGEIKDIKIVRGFDPLADDEVVRVVHALPRWNAAEINGEKVEAEQKLTISFTLNDELMAQTKKMKEDGATDNSYIGSSSIQEKTSDTEIAQSIEDNPTQNIDDPLNRAPQFPGGQEALAAYFKDNLKYPKRALQMKIEGRVIFKLLVSAEGEITKVMLYKSIFRDCDEEAYYLVKKMPKWNPGLKAGTPVAMEVMVPIPFVLPV